MKQNHAHKSNQRGWQNQWLRDSSWFNTDKKHLNPETYPFPGHQHKAPHSYFTSPIFYKEENLLTLGSED